MKRLLLLISTLLLVFTLSACEDACVGTTCVEPNLAAQAENILNYDHINGHGTVTTRLAYILFEHEMRDFVKYQVTYLSCTCREAEYNFWQTAYVEINKYTNDIRFISFGLESTGHYSPGNWGDSSPTPSGKTLEDFTNEFLPWINGKSMEDLAGISVFTNDVYFGIENTTEIAEQDLIDGFAGSSVSTNNMIRTIKVLLEYHSKQYN